MEKLEYASKLRPERTLYHQVSLVSSSATPSYLGSLPRHRAINIDLVDDSNPHGEVKGGVLTVAGKIQAIRREIPRPIDWKQMMGQARIPAACRVVNTYFDDGEESLHTFPGNAIRC